MDEDIPQIVFQATVLDQDNRPLASGEARLYTSLHSGVFWPQKAKDVHLLPNCAATLKSLDGSLYTIQNLKVCPHHQPEFVNHCEFDYSPIH